MSSAGIHKLFCGIYSTFKCSFDEFVGEKVFSPSYSSAILAPPLQLFGFNGSRGGGTRPISDRLLGNLNLSSVLDFILRSKGCSSSSHMFQPAGKRKEEKPGSLSLRTLFRNYSYHCIYRVFLLFFGQDLVNWLKLASLGNVVFVPHSHLHQQKIRGYSCQYPDWDFPGGPMVKNLPPNAGFDPWSTKIPQGMGQLSQCATTTELAR